MRPGIVALVLLLAWGVAPPADHRTSPPMPAEFVVGRHTFFDFGPPSDYYEVLQVRPATDGTSVERVLLTPGYKCTLAPKVEVAAATIKQSVAELFGATNPCAIPEKNLNRELERRKHYLVFSGADVTMQVQCGGQTRIVRSDILDRDWFDSHPNTPENTSWTMRILAQLDQALGPGVMDKPMITLPGTDGKSALSSDSPTLRDIAAGKYDGLFAGAPDKPSTICLSLLKVIPNPTVSFVKSSPFQPVLSPMPEYPAIARAAGLEGLFTFTVEVKPDGGTANFAVEHGAPLIQKSVEYAVQGWVFPKQAAGQRMEVTIEFALNCHATAN
jgi:hypothetical protein